MFIKPKVMSWNCLFRPINTSKVKYIQFAVMGDNCEAWIRGYLTLPLSDRFIDRSWHIKFKKSITGWLKHSGKQKVSSCSQTAHNKTLEPSAETTIRTSPSSLSSSNPSLRPDALTVFSSQRGLHDKSEPLNDGCQLSRCLYSPGTTCHYLSCSWV